MKFNKILFFSGIIFIGWLLLKKNKAGKNIIIGDSQSYWISKNIPKLKLVGSDGADKSLWKSGSGINWLMDQLSNQDPDETVLNVFICVGTNGGFNLNDPIDKLVKLTKEKFPSATIHFIKGSFGWGGNINLSEVDLVRYGQKFRSAGANVLKNSIGKTTNPHQELSNYKLIADEIKYIIQ